MKHIKFGNARYESADFMTLNELKDLASEYPNHKFKLAGTNLGILRVHSWRGSYYLPAISPIHAEVKGSDLLKELKETINEIQYGYKGGEYLMHGDDEFYVAHIGNADEYKVFHHEILNNEVILYLDIDEY